LTRSLTQISAPEIAPTTRAAKLTVPLPALKVTLDESVHAAESRAVELLALDEALEKLAAFDKRKAEVVEMRYFGGLTMEEIADVLKVHVNTVTREWGAARAWLFATLRGEKMDAI
jgi:RNA polymerase sigma factor (sigma-70 family)